MTQSDTWRPIYALNQPYVPPPIGSSIGRRPRYEFNDWNSWREADGFLCRNNDDCRWVDQNLNCEDYELDFSPAVSTYISNMLKESYTS